MHFNVVVLKLKSNESELAKKKKRTFLDYFFFIDPSKLMHLLQLRLLGWDLFNSTAKKYLVISNESAYIILKYILVYKLDRINLHNCYFLLSQFG